jgi:acyl dehydratase
VTAPLAVGDSLPEFRIESISAEAMKTMAVILDDPNVIHLDPEAVRSLGLGDRVINQGPSNSGYVMNMLLAAFPGAEIRRFTARFLSNVLAEDSVVAGGTVERLEPTDEGTLVHCSTWLRVNEGHNALAAQAVVLVK